jgi:amino acid transporter
MDGLSGHNFSSNWKSAYTEGSFSLYLALFFNACTGIFTGANAAADLKNPPKQIPIGTIAAHFFNTFLYFLLIILFGAAGTREALTNLNVVVSAVIAWPSEWVVYIGIILSSLAACLNNVMNAPHII